MHSFHLDLRQNPEQKTLLEGVAGALAGTLGKAGQHITAWRSLNALWTADKAAAVEQLKVVQLYPQPLTALCLLNVVITPHATAEDLMCPLHDGCCTHRHGGRLHRPVCAYVGCPQGRLCMQGCVGVFVSCMFCEWGTRCMRRPGLPAWEQQSGSGTFKSMRTWLRRLLHSLSKQTLGSCGSMPQKYCQLPLSMRRDGWHCCWRLFMLHSLPASR